MKRSNQTAAQFGATRSSALLQMIVVCAGLTLLLSIPANAGPKIDKEAFIDCVNGKFDSLELPAPEKNEVHQGNKLMWFVYGERGAAVHIEFVKKAGVACLGESPFPSPSFLKVIKKEYGLDKIPGEKVKTKEQDKDLCYNYKITCYKADGSVGHIIDPIIDVPKP